MAPTTDPLFDPAVVEDPYAYYDELRRTDPVHRVEGTDAFLVTRMDLIQQVVADTSTYSSRNAEFLWLGDDGPTVRSPAPDGVGVGAERAAYVLATDDPPDHTRQRRVLGPLFSRSAMEARAPELTVLVDAALGRCLPSGQVSWMADVAVPLPVLMIARLLGVPDELAPRLQAQGYAAVEVIGGFVPEERRAALVEAMTEVGPVLEAYAAARARAGGEPDTSTVVGTCARAVAAGELDELEALGALSILVAAGGESTSSLLGSTVRILAERPALQARLRADPSLIPTFIEEACRIEPPFRGHYRRVTVDTELGGTPLPAGARVVLAWPAANRDPDAVADPDDIDLDRPNPRHHVGFGWGVHLCLGAPLARLEARVILERLLARTRSFAVDPAAGELRHQRSLLIRRLVELPLVVEEA